MIFQKLTQDDIEQIKNNSISRGILSKQPGVIEFSYALRHEGKVLGIGGIILINTTTAWGWVDLTVEATEHIITVYRVIRDWTKVLCKTHGIKRLQCYIESDFPEAIRMAEHLGFLHESTMARFVDEKSAYLYVKYFNKDNTK